MKKSLLCILVAILVVLSSISFAVYNKYFTSYDYAKKDMSKYLPMITDAAMIEALYDGSSVKLEFADEEDVQYYIADALASIVTSSTKADDVGVFGIYDILNCSYYITTVIDGKEVCLTLPKALAPNSPVKVQLGSDSDLARLFAALAGYGMANSERTAFTTGSIYLNDNLYFDYSVKTAASTTTGENQKVQLTGSDFLEDIYAGLTAKFLAKMDTMVIGTAATITVVEDNAATTDVDEAVTVTITPNYVTRATVDKGALVDGDRVFFTYKEITATAEDDEALQYYAVLGTDDADLDKTFGDGFAAALKALTLGSASKSKVTAILRGVERTYEIDLDYAIPADPAHTAREGYHYAEKYISFTLTYPEDSEALPEAEDIKVEGQDEPLTAEDLAGKEITCYVIVENFYDLEYDYETVCESLGYAPETDGYDATMEATLAYMDAVTVLADAKAAYENGQQDDTLTPEELQALADAVTAAEAEVADAKLALDEQAEKYTLADQYITAYLAYVEAITAQEKLTAEATEEEIEDAREAVDEALEELVAAREAYAATLENVTLPTTDEITAAKTALEAANEALANAKAALETAKTAYAEVVTEALESLIAAVEAAEKQKSDAEATKTKAESTKTKAKASKEEAENLLPALQAVQTQATTALDAATAALTQAEAAYEAGKANSALSPEELQELADAVTEAEAAKKEAETAKTAADAEVGVAEKLIETATADITEATTAIETAEADIAAAEEAIAAAQTAYEAALTEAGTDAAAVEALAKAVEDAEKAVKDAETAQKNAKGDLEEAELEYELFFLEPATKVSFDAFSKKTVQDGFDTEYNQAVTAIIWKAMMKLAKESEELKYPSVAVHAAKLGIKDELKQKYYASTSAELREQYTTFAKYLKQYIYSGQDHKEAIEAEAEDIVLNTMLVYRLVEIYEVTEEDLDENQTYMLYIYEMYGMEDYVEAAKTAYFLDIIMDRIGDTLREKQYPAE